MFMRLTPDQQELASLMSEISESCYCAGWMRDLEYALWHMMVTGKAELARYRLPPATRDRLKALYERTGGWITFETNEGEVFVPADEWGHRFSAEGARHLPVEK